VETPGLYLNNGGVEGADTNSRAEAVKNWLNRTGFPLEHEVEVAFDEVGFNVERGWHYLDPETGKAREMDVIAHAQEDIPINLPGGEISVVTVNLAFFLECSHAETKEERKAKKGEQVEEETEDVSGRHWVVFSTPRFRYAVNSLPVMPIASPLAQYAIYQLAEHHRGLRLSLLRSPERGAYRVASAFAPKGYDPAYGNINKVIKGACSWLPEPLPLIVPLDLFIGFPVVVTDNTLFESWFPNRTDRERFLGEKAEAVVEPRRWMRLYWRGSSVLRDAVAVDIVTKDCLAQYAEMMMDGCKRLVQLLRDHLPTWAEDLIATGNMGEIRRRLEERGPQIGKKAAEEWEGRYGPDGNWIDRAVTG
jgi:hypothetical protein